MKVVVVGRDNLLRLLIAITLGVILLGMVAELLGAPGDDEALIRDPVVAGSFNPDQPREPQEMGDRYLMEADPEGTSLSEGAKSELLTIARESIKTYLDLGEVPEFETSHKELASLSGVFVTLYKYGRLRGCIGHFEADMPLHKVVAEMTVAAASKDRRFSPVSKGELDDIELEISVLSPLRKIDSIDEIILGKHGIRIVGTATGRYGTYTFKRLRRGCYLPKVATQMGWTKVEFLEHCSQDKAGLGKDGWRDADIYVFTTEVFGEK